MNRTKSLIAYYSRPGDNYVGGSIRHLAVGNTEVVATMIQRLTSGDLFRIETVKAYPSDYHQTTKIAQDELRHRARPELSGRIETIADYDVILLGYPNWWGTMPMAVYTFLESHDFAGKTILPFCTHEGSGLGGSENDLRKVCPSAKVLKGISIIGGDVRKAEPDLATWLRDSGVID